MRDLLDQKDFVATLHVLDAAYVQTKVANVSTKGNLHVSGE